jgi:hypothetical protein
MAIEVKHKFVSAKAEGADATKVRTSKWNELHDILMASGFFIGRTTAGAGAAEEIPFTAAGRSMINAADATAQRALISALQLSDILGQQTIWLPAGSMTPTTTNGAAPGKLELATNDVMVSYLAFDAAVAEKAQVMIQMPKAWNRGTIVAQFLWAHPAGSGNVVWGIRAVAFANDNPMDAAFGTAQTVTDGGGTENDCYISAETAAMTIAGSPTAEELVCFEVYRDAANGSDTMAVDAYLIGVKLHYTTEAVRDD